MPTNQGCTCTDLCRFYAGASEERPADCPANAHPDIVEQAKQICRDPESDAYLLWQAFAKLLHTGGAKKSRVEHLVDFSLALGVKTLGIASCLRYIREAHFLLGLLEREGFTAHLALCKLGGLKTHDIGVDKDTDWIVCNPLGQALLLNHLNCEVMVTLGLCMGHEMIFNRYAQGYVTNLIVKEKISEEMPRQTLQRMMSGQYHPTFQR